MSGYHHTEAVNRNDEVASGETPPVVYGNIALNLLQLEALSLPAFEILVEVIVESDFLFANMGLPIVVTGFVLFIVGWIIILLNLLAASISWQLRVVVVSLLGLLAHLAASAFGRRKYKSRRPLAIERSDDLAHLKQRGRIRTRS